MLCLCVCDQVDELEGADHFIPVSFENTVAGGYSDSPAIAGDELVCQYDPSNPATCFMAQTIIGTYADWDSSDTPISGSEWDIPAVCYTTPTKAAAKGEAAPPPVASRKATASWGMELLWT
jgi:hypothetical protein